MYFIFSARLPFFCFWENGVQAFLSRKQKETCENAVRVRSEGSAVGKGREENAVAGSGVRIFSHLPTKTPNNSGLSGPGLAGPQ